MQSGILYIRGDVAGFMAAISAIFDRYKDHSFSFIAVATNLKPLAQ